MSAMTWPARIALALAVLAAAGCATAPSYGPPARSDPARVRCLTDPLTDASGSPIRPLFYLFCIQSS